jgi:hypothetical protein
MHPHPGGATLAGGAASRERLGKALGVAALAGRGTSVVAVAWVADHIEIEVQTPGHGTVLLSVERARAGSPAFLRCGAVSIGYRGADALDPALATVIGRVAPRSLGALEIEDLARMIASDPDAGRSGEPLPLAPLADQQRFDRGALLASWGSPDVWSRFFAVAETARAQLDSLDTFNHAISVQHCDPECLFLAPQTGVPMVPLALYPWDDRVRRIDWRRPGRRREPDPSSTRLVTTELDERHVVMGSSLARLDAALASLDPDRVPRNAMVFCASTCVPVVAGEDTEAVVRAHQQRLAPVPLLHLTTTPFSMQSLLRDLLVARRLEAERRSGPPDTGSINLVGFSEDPALDDLAGLLARLGISINAAVLPALDPELIDRLPRASLAVVHPSETWQGHYEQLLFDSRTPWISPPAPYGRGGTLRWLSAVASALGVEVDMERELRDRLHDHDVRLEALRSRASTHRIGFVVRDDEAFLLTRPEKTSGVPLVPLVREMGFGVRVLLHVSGTGSSVEAEIRALLDHEPDAVVILGSSSELRDALDGVSAVYSEHFFDRRLTSAGLASFSGQHFERGLDGELRTLRRLVELCELPFYRRYGQHVS